MAFGNEVLLFVDNTRTLAIKSDQMFTQKHGADGSTCKSDFMEGF